jgi:ATP-binding cassette subfamily B protein
MKHLLFLNKYFVKYKWYLVPGLFFVIVSNLFAVVPAQVVGHAFNLILDNVTVYRLFQGFDQQTILYQIFGFSLLFLGIIVLSMYLLRGVFLFLMRQTIILMSRHIEYDLKNEIYAHYQKLSLGFYRRNNTGDLMSRATEDVNRVRMYVGPAIMYAANTVSLFGMIIFYMFSVNAALSFYSLLPLPLLVFIIYLVTSKINQQSERIQAQLAKLSAFVQERFSGIRVVKAYVRERHIQTLFAAESENYKGSSMALVKIQAFFYPAMLLLVGLSTILAVYIGGEKVISGSITAGNIAEFIVYLNQLSFPVSMLGWVTTLVQRAAASQKRINEFLHLEPEITSGTAAVTNLNQKISFHQVSLSYPDTGIKALNEVSFDINPGEFVAIIGKTGSGKSTLVNLLLRMYDCTSGKIQLGETQIQELNLQDYRNQIGFVPQDVFLFSDTIKNNIAFGLNEANNQQIIDAAKQAAVYQNVIQFEKGFDTVLGERGITLSGGQKQRVSIARAFIKQPNLIVFDDCLSAVDTKTEEEILHNLGALMKGKTSLIVSHRISTIRHADKILVLDKGKIIAQGKHDELIKQNGLYAEMYQHQLLEEEERKVAIDKL